jgi:hypothetical protein
MRDVLTDHPGRSNDPASDHPEAHPPSNVSPEGGARGLRDVTKPTNFPVNGRMSLCVFEPSTVIFKILSPKNY